MKVLQIVESGYRCTVEEQDDPAVWITHAMKGAGATLGVLLRGSAVSYATNGHDASGLSFGGKPQTQPSKLDRDIASLIQKGIPVYAVQEDLDALGIPVTGRVEGVQAMPRTKVASLFGEYDQVWHW